MKSNILSSVVELIPCCSGELKGNVLRGLAVCPDELEQDIARRTSITNKDLTDAINNY
jgi:hypothetical protein